MKLCIYKTMFVFLSVCLFPKNSKPTRHMNLKFCVYTIYDNESEIRYLKLTSEVCPNICFILFFLFSTRCFRTKHQS